MESEKIIEDLNRRFSQPLPEFYNRRIIVWYDEDGEFQEQLSEITLDNARIVALTGSNNFEVKKIIAVDDTTSNILLYNPQKYNKPDDNWFTDILMYGESFRADMISMMMEEMGVTQSVSLRKVVKDYKKFFNAKERRNKFSQIYTPSDKPSLIHLCVMASIAGIKEAEPERILYAVLSAGLDAEENQIYSDLKNFEAEQAFIQLVKQGTGYYEEEMNFNNLISHIVITALTRTVRPEYLNGLEGFISEPNQSWCYDFISDWMRDDLQGFCEIARKIEDKFHIVDRFSKLDIEELMSTDCLPCVNEVIISKLMDEIQQEIIQIPLIKKVVDKRRVCAWYDDGINSYYEGILQTANMQSFYLNHQEGFHYTDAKQIWKEYTTEYYQMDMYYRLFHKAYADILVNYNPELQDKFTAVREYTDRIYNNWFLGQLGSNWSDIAADDLREYGFIQNVKRQDQFYKTEISSEKNRVYVIISDALRYETAKSLEEQLQRETQCKINMDTMQAVFPTVTKFGMAALLPHKEMTLSLSGGSEKISVLCDGMSTESTNREKVLKTENDKSVVLQYKDILPMNRAQRQALVRDMDVVYIYHNKIDHASHTDEHTVFTACDEAITEIKNMVRIITNEFSGSNIYITSDHGFLYTYTELKEDSKLDKAVTGNDIVEYSRRYVIAGEGAETEYMIPVKMLGGNTGYSAFAPRENIRIKMNGAGMNFVHGGISLQEMVVPLISYSNVRNDSKEYRLNKNQYDTKPVSLSLMTSSHKISNLIFSLNFLQDEAVSANRTQMDYTVYFTDAKGAKISDVQRIIADKTEDNPQQRSFRVSFNLRNATYNKAETYYLVIGDREEHEISKTEFQIDIAFSADEFNFF